MPRRLLTRIAGRGRNCALQPVMRSRRPFHSRISSSSGPSPFPLGRTPATGWRRLLRRLFGKPWRYYAWQGRGLPIRGRLGNVDYVGRRRLGRRRRTDYIRFWNWDRVLRHRSSHVSNEGKCGRRLVVPIKRVSPALTRIAFASPLRAVKAVIRRLDSENEPPETRRPAEGAGVPGKWGKIEGVSNPDPRKPDSTQALVERCWCCFA